jgi:ketosteroid isomerase-like protein
MSIVAERVTRFFANQTAGAFDADLMHPQFRAWTTTSGDMPAERYRTAPQQLAAVFKGGLQFEIDSIIVEGDRAAAEVRSHGVFHDGTAYDNRYVFIFELTDNQISSVAEHFNPEPVMTLLVPRLMALMKGD